MHTIELFGIPIYRKMLEGSGLDIVQKELFEACESVKFAQNRHWTSNTHELSENPFNECILTKNECNNFLRHLDFCIKQYLNTLPNSEVSNNLSKHPNYRITASWFTKTKKGQHAHLHSHGDADIAGVYYVQSNNQDGELSLRNPNVMLQSNYVMSMINPDKLIMPEVGALYLWPGMIEHQTATNKTDHERISLSFNIRFNSFMDQE